MRILLLKLHRKQWIKPFITYPNQYSLVAEEQTAIKLQVVLDESPDNKSAFETVERLRDEAYAFLTDSGFSTNEIQLHYGGQTAEQVDVQKMNKRDMIVLFSSVIILLTIILSVQTRSIVLPVLMMFTILPSYTASLGFESSYLISSRDVMRLLIDSLYIPLYLWLP